MRRNSRKAFLINPSFQYRIIAWMVGVSLAPISAFFVAHYYFFWQLKKLGLNIQLDPGHIYFRFLEGQSRKLMIIYLVSSVLAILIVATLGLLLSHRVAGPIHRLKSYLTELTNDKQLPALSFRKNDFFLELPPIVNRFINHMKGKKDQ